MAGNTQQSLKAVFDNIRKTIKATVNSTDLRAVGEYAIDLIVGRTREGYGVTRLGGGKTRLKPLAKSTIKKREYASRKGLLSPLTSPAKSNLTMTAAMLDSMGIVKFSSRSVSIGPTGRRGRTSNASIAEYNAQKGRVFNNLSNTEFKSVVEFYKARIEKIIRR